MTHAAARVFDREDICWYLLAYTSQFEFMANVVEDEGGQAGQGRGRQVGQTLINLHSGVRACVRDGARVCKSGRPGPARQKRDSENGIRKNGIRKNGIRKKRDSAFKPIGPGPAKTGSSLSVLCSYNSRAISACMYAPS